MRKNFVTCFMVLSFLAIAALAVPKKPASVAGAYANLSFNVDGAGGQNRLVPRLELRSDSRYRWGRELGTYEYRDGKIYLSGSYAAWGPGRVDKDAKIWFEFTRQGKRYMVTMYWVSEK